MKKLVVLTAPAVLVVILAGSSPSVVSDDDISPTRNDVSTQETTTNETEAGNS